MRARTLFLTCLLVRALAATADNSGVDPAEKYSWIENTGWANLAPTNSGVTVHFDGTLGHLTGFAWGENIGWIKLGDASGGPYANNSATDWGVNMDANGALSGYAWGENVGWINFAPTAGAVSIDVMTGRFTGKAWGENIGWVSFSGSSPSYGVRTLAFDKQARGTPNWWLQHHGVTETSDEGDGVPAWEEYVADTSPADSASYLHLISVTNTLTSATVAFAPSSTHRFYTLVTCSDLVAGTWSNVTGQVNVPGTGGAQNMTDMMALPQVYYKVQAVVAP